MGSAGCRPIFCKAMPRMKRLAIYNALIGFLSACISMVAVAQETDSIQSALSARVSFSDLNGARLQTLPRGVPFNITVSIDNEIGSEPPAGLYLNGWLRQQSQHNLDCQSAARAYLATGRSPVGSVDLNGPVIGVLTEEAHLTIADPELDLASANLIGATSFGELPAAFVHDANNNRFLISLAKSGDVLAVNALDANRTILAENLNQPDAIIPARNGAVWVLEKGSGDLLHLGTDGGYKRLPLKLSSMRAGSQGYSFVAWNESEFHVINRLNGDRVIDKENSGIAKHNGQSVADVVAIEDQRSTFAVAALTGASIALYYIDEPAQPININLPTPSQRLAVDPFGRFLFAYSPEGGDTSIIDIARSRVVQVVGAGTPVINIEFTENAAFLMLADQSMVGVIDLASIKAGQHAMVREVDLGQAATNQNSANNHATQRQLLAPLAPGNEMLAVHAASYTGFIIHESSAMGDAPPMSAVKLRGGIPHQITVIDRSFREIATGQFRTTAMLPANGQFELVVTTGIGSLSACMPLHIDGLDDVKQSKPGTMLMVPSLAKYGSGQGARLHLQTADGEPAQQVRAEVTFSALEANWRYRAVLETDHEGISRNSYELPPLGEFAITVSTATEQEFQPLLYQVK